MGYRERRAHKSQQKQESLGQTYSGEQRVSLPAPQGMNSRDNSEFVPQSQAVQMENFVPETGRLVAARDILESVLIPNNSLVNYGVITYKGSGDGLSAEAWVVGASSGAGNPQKAVIYDVGGTINRVMVSATAGVSTSAIFSFSMSATGVSPYGYDYTTFNKTVIAVNGRKALKWTRASAWDLWSATASGGAVNNFWGINKFKSRLFAWEDKSTKFWYGSADQVLGTFNSFDLQGIINEDIMTMVNITRDGGAGPDDYAAFISKNGEVAVYAGTDPADANAWSLVGVYKIGKPLSRDSHINYGQQSVVLCADDFYFMPEDLMGKKQSTPAADVRYTHDEVFGADAFNSDMRGRTGVNSVFWDKKNLLIFSEGSVLDPKNNYSYSTLKLIDKGVHTKEQRVGFNHQSGLYAWSNIFTHRGRLWSLKDAIAASADAFTVVAEIHPDTRSYNEKFLFSPSRLSHTGRIVTAPIKTSGRTNITMVNPILKIYNPNVGLITKLPVGSPKIKYRTAVVYDASELVEAQSASAEGLVWQTSTASSDSTGIWIPAAGTGTRPQIVLEILSTSATADVVFERFDFTISDTGGI